MGRIVALELPLWGATARVRAIHSGGLGGRGWNACLKVAEVLSTTSLRVYANAFSAQLHPVTGAAQEDLDWFLEGDLLRCIPIGDHDLITGGAASVELLAIDRVARTLNLTAPHGLTGVGATVEPVSEAQASTLWARLAWFDSAELG